MKDSNRTFVSIVIMLGFLLWLLFACLRYPVPVVRDRDETEEEPPVWQTEDEEALEDAYEQAEKTLLFWYDEWEMEPFFYRCALDYYHETGIAVDFRLYEGVSYLSDLYEESIREEGECPDGYLIGADVLEEAYLTGLAAERPEQLADADYADTACAAVTLRGKQYGYPVYMDTPVFVYLTEAFETAPASIQAMLDFLAENDLPIEVGNLIEWDIDDEYYDFVFVGDCFSFSDEVYGHLTVDCDEALYRKKLDFLDALSESITLDSGTISEGSVVSRLNHRATASAVMDADDLSDLKVPYGVLPLLPLHEELSMRGAAKTDVLLVNGFSAKHDAAADFARFVSTAEQPLVHAYTGHFAAMRTANEEEEEKIVYEAYENACPMPHSVDSAGFWKSLRSDFLKLF